jgi:hypothetical protein
MGLHALDIVALCTNMLLLYKNAASMLDFILAMEVAQNKAKQAELPILDIELGHVCCHLRTPIWGLQKRDQ